MITLITGAPGTGKTAALVSLLSALGKNRALYVDGIPELKLDHVSLDDGLKGLPDTVVDAYSKVCVNGQKPSGANFWPNIVPDGSIIVIDEVQRVWRPRGPGSKVPPDIAALETHRHRGLDFYIITQSPRLVDTNVRALVGRHVHLRDLGLLGRFWYEWPECAEQCSSTWKTAPIKKRYRLPKAIFNTYKSASEHIKPVRSVPWMVAVLMLALVITAALGFKTFSMISSKVAPVATVEKKPDSIGDITARHASADVSTVAPYDTTLFIPRVSNKPESAPAFDHLRVVVVMPMVVGGLCVGDTCKCITQQGTNAGLSTHECKQWLANPPFNPYQLPAPSEARGTPAQAPNAPMAAPVGGAPAVVPAVS